MIVLGEIIMSLQYVRCVLLWTLFIGNVAHAQQGGAIAGAGCAHERGVRRQFCEDVSQYAQALHLPGYAVAVARQGKLVYVHTAGYANVEQHQPIRTDSIFPVASVTKTFTATLMMQYVAEGRIHLDDYLVDYPQIDDAALWPFSSAEIRIRHVLSHTSEGHRPGDVFSYNGNRFNYVYGVFVKTTGEKDYAKAFGSEVKSRILDRLGLKDTLTRVPPSNDEHAARVVTPYRYDVDRAAFVPDDDLRTGHARAYPNSGMLSTLADLAHYVDAVYRGELVGKAGASTMTAPFKLNDGTLSPYGLGWFSEVRQGTALHWVYGLGPSYASLVLDIPDQRLSLIFLANNDGPTAALRLNYGNVLQFPFVASFLKHFAGVSIPLANADTDIDTWQADLSSLSAAERDIVIDQLVGVGLTQRYTEQHYDAEKGRALALVRLLYRIDPDYFNAFHPEMIALVAAIQDRSLLESMNELAVAYDRRGHIDPRVSQDLGDFYDRIGMDEQAIRYRKALVDEPGYESNDATIASAFALGKDYFRRGNAVEGRKYYWLGIRDAVGAGWGAGFAENKRREMNKLLPGDAATGK